MKRFALVLLLAAPGLAQAQMYKCVDERGVTHYSDKPRPGCKGGEVNIRPQPPVSGASPSGARDLAGQEADFKRRQVERAQAEEKEKTAQAATAERCAQLRRQHGVLTAGVPVGTYDSKGERVYWDDKKREAELAQVNRGLGACP